MRDLAVSVRFTADEMTRLDELRGASSRAEYLRRLLQDPPPEGEPTHREAIQILYSLAKDGRVGAAIALERALAERPADTEDEFEQIIRDLK